MFKVTSSRHAGKNSWGKSMGLNESDTRAKLIDPALHVRGWTEDFIKREETAGAIEIINGSPRKQTGRVVQSLNARCVKGAECAAATSAESNSGSFFGGPGNTSVFPNLTAAPYSASHPNLNLVPLRSRNSRRKTSPATGIGQHRGDNAAQ
jgi:hypothetical protein